MVDHGFADNGSVATEIESTKRIEYRLGPLRAYDGYQFAFVGDIERIEAENLAGASDFLAQRYGRFLELESDTRLSGDFIERAGNPSSCRVA